MEAEYVGPVTPATDFDKANLWSTEDSGYHTSFTPGSIECSELSNENIDPKIYSKQNVSLNSGQGSYLKSPRWKNSRFRNNGSPKSVNITPTSPNSRRGKKRHHEDNLCLESIPTKYIEEGIKRLHVSDTCDLILNQRNKSSPIKKSHSISNEFFGSGECSQVLSYPTTPVKKISRNIKCKLSPLNYNYGHKSSPLRPLNVASTQPKKSVKKLNFGSHGQSKDKPSSETTHACDTVFNRKVIQSKLKRSIFKPEQKVDIIKMLYQRQGPALVEILKHLNSKDTYNFSCVSVTWRQACNEISTARHKKEEYIDYIIKTKENLEVRDKYKGNDVGSLRNKKSTSSLSDIDNIISMRMIRSPQKRSPPGTPRTIRFKKYVKSASLDSRVQLPCVRCRHPAKVSEEATGEEWAECGSITCSFQFCKICKCDRHPGKKCFLYDIEAPSPSKKKPTVCGVGTNKSKKNLRRLIMKNK